MFGEKTFFAVQGLRVFGSDNDGFRSKVDLAFATTWKVYLTKSGFRVFDLKVTEDFPLN